MFLEKGQVLWNKKLSSSYFKLGLKLSGSFYDANPALFSYLLLDHHGNIRQMTPDMPSPVRVSPSRVPVLSVASESS